MNIGKPTPDPVVEWYQHGGLTNGVTSLAGEKGPEWVVPTYEPERSAFLRDVGMDPDALGASIAKSLQPLLNGGSGRPIKVTLEIDSREIGNVMIDQLNDNPELNRRLQLRMH